MKEMEFCMDEFEVFRRTFKKTYPGGSVNKLMLHWLAYNISMTVSDMLGTDHIRFHHCDDPLQ